MINVTNLSYTLPQKQLYDNISFSIEAGQHCALLGISGSGKSSLIDLLLSTEDFMYEGEIALEPGVRMSYIAQLTPPDALQDRTVFEYIGAESIRLEDELTAIYTAMGTETDLDQLMLQLDETTAAFEARGGSQYEAAIDKALYTAELTHLRDVPVASLSGGEFKLIQVMKEMLTAPDVLIMDEPDVFLDFDNLNSLRNLINTHQGTLIVITHDRYLLNHCFNKILHLENKQLQEFDGTYIDYTFSLLETKIEIQELAHDDAEEIKRNELLLADLRNIASQDSEAARGKTVHARAKIQERLKARQIKAPFVEIKEPTFRLHTDQALEESPILTVTDYRLAFDELLLENVTFEIGATDKVVLIGPNGTGKTTLLRAIFENNHEAIQLAEGTHVAYLSQVLGETLDEAATVSETLFNAGFERLDDIHACLEDYGFAPDMIDQAIGSLSGGERNIVQLAKLSVSNANFLLLDEPTSHLDTYSQIALEKALKAYNGAILMVSHAFYSIINSMDYVLLIDEKTIRRSTMKKFRRMIYKKHFDRDYLELEQEKLRLETAIARALTANDFLHAQALAEELEVVIKQF